MRTSRSGGSELLPGNENGWLETVVDTGWDLEVVVEVLGNISLTDSTGEISFDSISLPIVNDEPAVGSFKEGIRRHTDPCVRLVPSMVRTPKRIASAQN